ncbi:MAG: hypothetical protein J7L54_07500 [Elusimicrobia bacterium]|nr:hypothetical protein [Elusimicrobiota bacterium]
MKRFLAILLLITFSFGVVSLTIAGWGGRLKCLSCKFESESLHIGGGKAISYAIIYCDKCKNFFSIPVKFNKKHIRGNHLQPDKKIEECKTNIVRPLGEVYVYELEKTIKIYPCPKCGQMAIEVDGKIITDAVARRTKDGKLQKVGKCLLCPRCNKKTLYFDLMFKWD